MELQQLRYAVAVARTGNFSRAAAQCHVSQPSLSQQIHKLEAELGERLFDRLPRHARPTAAGTAFLARAERVLAEIDLAQREAQDGQSRLRGPLTIGVLPTIAPYLLPRVIAAFTRKFPEVEVIVQEDTTARLLQLGCACELDLVVASLPVHDTRFEREVLFEEELLLALPARHRLARQKRITLSDLKGERFILMKEGHCLGDQVLDFCQRRDFHPQVSCRSGQIETVRALVQAGLGVSLVPQMAIGRSPAPQPVYRSFTAPRPSRAIVVYWARQRPLIRAAEEFLRCLREA
jgi:LysR family hydrogen peroxide-inducible transcriptional activator